MPTDIAINNLPDPKTVAAILRGSATLAGAGRLIAATVRRDRNGHFSVRARIKPAS